MRIFSSERPDVPCHQREHRAHGVRRLRGHVDGELAGDAVEVGDAAAGLDGGHVDARQVEVLRHGDVRLGKGLVRGGPISRLPVEDAVVLLVLLVGAQDRRRRVERLPGIDHRRHRLVLHLHRLHAVGGGVAVGGDHRRDLLRLVHHRVGGQHHLGVRHQRRHPVQVVLLQRLAGDHRQHARYLEGLGGVDGLDLRVGEGAAHDVHVQHAGKLDVVHVVAAAADEARVLLPLHRVTHAANRRARLGFRHGCSPIAAAASRLRIRWP